MTTERIIICFHPDGTFRGASATDYGGQPVEISALELPNLGIDIAALARVSELETIVSSIPEKDQHLAELTEQLETANARITELTAPPVVPSLISNLHAAFTSTLPLKAQVAFAGPYAIVRTLILADQMQLAASYIASVPVPAEFELAKQSIIDLIAGATLPPEPQPEPAE